MFGKMAMLAGTCRFRRLLHSRQHKQTSMTRVCENVRKIITNTWACNGHPNAFAATVLVALEEQQAVERAVEIAALAQVEEIAVDSLQYLESSHFGPSQRNRQRNRHSATCAGPLCRI